MGRRKADKSKGRKGAQKAGGKSGERTPRSALSTESSEAAALRVAALRRALADSLSQLA